MSGILIVTPASEPLTLAEAKAFLRIEHDDDDDVITSLISAARTHIETLTRCATIAQTWRFIRDSWPDDGRVALKRGPVLSIEAVRVFDTGGVASSLDSESFVVDKASNTVASPIWSLPAPGRVIAGIEIDAVLGFGVGAASIPENLRHAIRLLLAHWYEHRGLERETSGAVLPAQVHALIAPYRVLAL
jgi:uncharacterized phiE125 gp8 family phage protein